ncbi:MAG: ABC transporter ATP-binding protein [Patescibacteria group bacterium]
MEALSISNLSKTYSTGVKALKHINLTIESGDFFALLGANGAGKTTMIGILTSLVVKTEGVVKVFDKDLDKDINYIKSQIGVVPQEFNFSIFDKVKDIVVWQAGYFGISRGEASDKADKILDQLGLGEKKDDIAKNLSGGMKRRLMIARALIHSPKFLILDEPTAGVDVELRYGMWEYLKKLNHEQGVTILLTTHYLEEVEQLCKNAAIIKDGEIVKKDSVKSLLTSLNKETYQFDVKGNTSNLEVKDYDVVSIDEDKLEVTFQKEQNINDFVIKLNNKNINIYGIRPKGNRLEELFLNIVKNK